MKRFLMILTLSTLVVGPALADSGSTRGNPSAAIGKSVANGSAIAGLSVAVPLIVAGAAGSSVASTSIETLSSPLHVTEKTFVSRGPSPAEVMENDMNKKEER